MQSGRFIWLFSLIALSACSQVTLPIGENAPSKALEEESVSSGRKVSAAVSKESDGIAVQGVAGQPEQSLRDSYYDCASSNDGSTWEMQGCIEAEYGYQDDRLNMVYGELLSKLPDEEKRILRESERKWLSSRDAECEWDAESEGQAQRVEANACALKETAARALELEEMLRGLE